jgi:hypothetical protein
MIRRLLALLLSAFAGSLVLGVAAPAHAADVYRYWSFFTVESGVYQASDIGVGGLTPADGSIEAFRYAAPVDYPPTNLPRIDLATVTFESVCADTAAVAGQKRVAVLVDFGVTEDSEGATIPAAAAECALVPLKATALQALQKVTDVRTKSSSFGPMLCAIEGYPASGCGEAKVDAATPADSGFVTVTADEPAAEDDDSNTALYAGLGAIVLALIAGGVFVTRRNKSA